MRWFVCLVLLLLCAGCAHRTESQPVLDVPEAAVREQHSPSPALPAPDDLPRRSGATIAANLYQRSGGEFDPILSNNAVLAGLFARFSPNFAPGGGITGLAYALYEFDLQDYTGAPELHTQWSIAPAEGSSFIGLANWGTNAWDWYALPSTGTPLVLPALEPYRDGTGRAVVAVALSGTEVAELEALRFGAAPAGPAWHAVQLSTEDYDTRDVNLIKLNGLPAIVYWRAVIENPTTNPVRVVNEFALQRALDAQGEQWGEPEVIWDVPDTDPYRGVVWSLRAFVIDDRLTLLTEVAGNDVDFTNRVLYLRAQDAAATALDPPQVAHEDNMSVEQLIDAKVVDGHMAFLVHHSGFETYTFHRANDIAGANWTSVEVDDPTHTIFFPPRSLLFAGDHVAVLYPYESGAEFEFSLRFRRASTPDGVSGWETPIDLLPEPAAHADAYGLALADGTPAFMYGNNSDFAWMVANDPLGNTWPAAGQPVSGFSEVRQIDVELLGDLPAAGYTVGSSNMLYFRQAADAQGASWAEPQFVSGARHYYAPSMALLDGNPALGNVVAGHEWVSYPVVYVYR